MCEQENSLKMRFGFAKRSDENQIKQLLAECELPYDDITLAHLRHFLVLRDDNQLVGVIGLEILGDASLLRSLAVQSQYRGRSFGSQLVKRAEEYAHSQGTGTLYLLTTTAEGFFANLSYKMVKRDAIPAVIKGTAEFQSLCPADALCMVMQLVDDR